jgi:uncharacterized protein (DUF427 family)
MSPVQDHSATITPVTGRVHIFFDDAEIAKTIRAVQLERPGHPVRLFMPLEDIHPGILEASDTTKDDEALGQAHFYTVKTLTADGVDEAWYYPYAEGQFEAIRDLITFGGDRVKLQISDV